MTYNVNPCPWYMDFDKSLIPQLHPLNANLNPLLKLPQNIQFHGSRETINNCQYLPIHREGNRVIQFYQENTQQLLGTTKI